MAQMMVMEKRHQIAGASLLFVVVKEARKGPKVK